ncbi:hypothetical protein VTL71DRAFT_5835 [Oculimacula yallundae]|uniref:2EXR domain-containing protein n=1 Tax=Oculimacula yallundae TaxID=86028 RepID=A0ABR4BYN9_9HELO
MPRTSRSTFTSVAPHITTMNALAEDPSITSLTSLMAALSLGGQRNNTLQATIRLHCVVHIPFSTPLISNSKPSSPAKVNTTRAATCKVDVSKIRKSKGRKKRKQKAATDFPNFSKLPAELRIQIWKEAMPSQRIVQIRSPYKRVENSVVSCRFLCPQKSAHIFLFRLRSTCKESYDEVMKKYRVVPFASLNLVSQTDVPKPSTGRGIILLNDAEDVVHFSVYRTWVHTPVMARNVAQVRSYHTIQSVAISIKLIINFSHPSRSNTQFNIFIHWLGNFPELKRLILTYGGDDDHAIDEPRRFVEYKRRKGKMPSMPLNNFREISEFMKMMQDSAPSDENQWMVRLLYRLDFERLRKKGILSGHLKHLSHIQPAILGCERIT